MILLAIYLSNTILSESSERMMINARAAFTADSDVRRASVTWLLSRFDEFVQDNQEVLGYPRGFNAVTSIKMAGVLSQIMDTCGATGFSFVWETAGERKLYIKSAGGFVLPYYTDDIKNDITDAAQYGNGWHLALIDDTPCAVYTETFRNYTTGFCCVLTAPDFSVDSGQRIQIRQFISAGTV